MSLTSFANASRSPWEARGQRPILGGAVLGTHPEAASVGARLGMNSRQSLSILGR